MRTTNALYGMANKLLRDALILTGWRMQIGILTGIQKCAVFTTLQTNGQTRTLAKTSLPTINIDFMMGWPELKLKLNMKVVCLAFFRDELLLNSTMSKASHLTSPS